MKLNKDKLLSLILNIATSGKYTKESEFIMSDYLIRYVLLNFASVLGIIILISYNFMNYKKGLYNIVITSTVLIIILLICFIMSRTKIPQKINSFFLLFFYLLFCAWMSYIEQVLGLNFLFIYVYPLLSIMLLGLNIGVILSSVLLLLMVLIMLVPGLSNYNYHFESFLRIFVTYNVVFFVMIVIELTRKTKDNLIEKQRQKLHDYNKNLMKMVEEKTVNILELQDALLRAMAELVEFRDDVTGSHIERTYKGITIFLNEMEKDSSYNDEIVNLNKKLIAQSSMLHDIGKISISDNILKKKEALNKEEFEEIKKHTVLGEKIIEKIEVYAKESEFLKYAKIFAANHHEKWDGTGYPRGLKGNEIPLLGRIMAIADVYDALTSVRPYKEAYSYDDAVKIIIEQKGKQFDPELVNMFIKIAKKFKK